MPQVSVDRAISAARMGNLISFPTDTVPALATLPERAELIFQAKQRSQDKPLILMAGEVADLWFHSMILLAQFNLTPQDVVSELARREGISGIEEKAARKDEFRDVDEASKS